MLTKKCTKCNRDLPVSHFGVNYRSTGALKSQCKDCYADRSRHYRQANPEKKKENDKKYYDRKKDAILKNCKKYREEHRHEKNVRSKAYRALKSGKLIPAEKCSMCERKENIVAHHYDYNKPLDVLWVCQKCHAAIHGRGLKRVS